MHALKQIYHVSPTWKEDPALDELADHIPYGSTNKRAHLFIDRLNRCTIEMNILGGKISSCFCNKIFVVLDMVWTSEQQQIHTLQPLHISILHASMDWVRKYMENF